MLQEGRDHSLFFVWVSARTRVPGTQSNICWPYLNDHLFLLILFLKAEQTEPEAEEEIEGGETDILERPEPFEVAEEAKGSLPQESEMLLVPETEPESG